MPLPPVNAERKSRSMAGERQMLPVHTTRSVKSSPERYAMTSPFASTPRPPRTLSGTAEDSAHWVRRSHGGGDEPGAQSKGQRLARAAGATATVRGGSDDADRPDGEQARLRGVAGRA